MWSISSARIVRVVLAPALSLWVAGVGCLLGCEGRVAAATKPGSDAGHHNATLVGTGHACSSRKSHSCCANGKTKLKPEAEPNKSANTTLITVRKSSSGMMQDCPLAINRAAVAAKIRSVEVSATSAIGLSTFHAGGFHEQTIPLSTPPRLPNRGHTYLRCCVFLI